VPTLTGFRCPDFSKRHTVWRDTLRVARTSAAVSSLSINQTVTQCNDNVGILANLFSQHNGGTKCGPNDERPNGPNDPFATGLEAPYAVV